jgi:hypothetical protein
VTGGIVSGVGLGLDDPTGRHHTVAIDDEQLAEQIDRDGRSITLEPPRRQRSQSDNRS